MRTVSLRPATGESTKTGETLTCRQVRFGHNVSVRALKTCQVFELPGDSCGGAMSSKTNKARESAGGCARCSGGVEHAGVIRYVNCQTELLFGYDRDDLIGAPTETLVADWEGHVAAPFTGTIGRGLELRGRRRDGTQFPVDIALSHTDTQDGPLMVAAVRDMTDRTKTDESRRHFDRLAAIVGHSDDAIIGKTLDGIVTSWNPAAQRMYAYSAEEITGKSIDLLSSPGDTGAMHTIPAWIGSGQPVGRFETTSLRKDGSSITVSLTVSPVHDQCGVIIGPSTIACDMTARQAFEAARSMIESSLDSFVAVSAEGKFTVANQATVTHAGVPRDKFIGTSSCDYFTAPPRPRRSTSRCSLRGWPCTTR